MRARLAKILQTDVGRKMLTYLNMPGRDDGDRMRIVAELPASTPTQLQGPDTPRRTASRVISSRIRGRSPASPTRRTWSP